MSTTHDGCHHRIYFLSCDDYDALWKRARGACEICRTPAADVSGGKLYIDHDHRYGDFAVRGLLCPRCNNGLMRQVDDGTRPWEPRVAGYLRNAWFLGVLRDRHETNVKRSRAS